MKTGAIMALAASFANGRLKLAKSEPGSAVFLVRFVRCASKKICTER